MAVFNGMIFSYSLGFKTSISVIIPGENNARKSDMPLLYLLHGLSDDHHNWLYQTSITRYAEQHNIIVVMPEVQRSFYADMEHGPKYFTYVAQELPQIMETLFGLTHKRKTTFVAGLSMGGYGAMKCALTRPEFYGKIASFSGALDAEAHRHDSLMPDFYLPFGNEMKPENDLFSLCERLPKKNRPDIFITCGTEDFLYQDNVNFRRKLEEQSIP
ncbi:MAG: hypothetical protein BGN88_06770, partial [Clostridiales bacterium 43-6]